MPPLWGLCSPTQQWCICGQAMTEEAREKVKVATEQAEQLPEFAMMQKQIKDLQDQIIAMQKGSGQESILIRPI